MSDDLSRASGAGPTINWQGKTWTVKGRTVGHHGLVNAEIIKRRGNPMQSLVAAASVADVTPQVIDAICQSVAKNFRSWSYVTHHDWFDFTRSRDGEAYVVWLSLRHNDDSLTQEDVMHHLVEAVSKNEEGWDWKEELLEAIDQASGGGDLGNWIGPSKRGATGEPHGDSSTDG